MAKRSAREVTAELSRAVANARETFMESATLWVKLRQRFLIMTGKQPGSGRGDRLDRPRDTRR